MQIRTSSVSDIQVVRAVLPLGSVLGVLVPLDGHSGSSWDRGHPYYPLPALGLVVYTGPECRAAMNNSQPRSKERGLPSPIFS